MEALRRFSYSSSLLLSSGFFLHTFLAVYSYTKGKQFMSRLKVRRICDFLPSGHHRKIRAWKRLLYVKGQIGPYGSHAVEVGETFTQNASQN